MQVVGLCTLWGSREFAHSMSGSDTPIKGNVSPRAQTRCFPNGHTPTMITPERSPFLLRGAVSWAALGHVNVSCADIEENIPADAPTVALCCISRMVPASSHHVHRPLPRGQRGAQPTTRCPPFSLPNHPPANT